MYMDEKLRKIRKFIPVIQLLFPLVHPGPTPFRGTVYLPSKQGSLVGGDEYHFFYSYTTQIPV